MRKKKEKEKKRKREGGRGLKGAKKTLKHANVYRWPSRYPNARRARILPVCPVCRQWDLLFTPFFRYPNLLSHLQENLAEQFHLAFQRIPLKHCSNAFTRLLHADLCISQ